MNRREQKEATKRETVPYMRGDEPNSNHLDLEISEPFPTCVGMNRNFPQFIPTANTVPYMRGDEPSSC